MSGNDMLLWFESDAATRLAMLYLESFGNPRKFARTARQLGRTMPVLAVNAGRSGKGKRLAAARAAATVPRALRHVGATPQGRVPDLDGLAEDRAGELVGGFLADTPDGGWLTLDSTADLLSCYGVRLADGIAVTTEHAVIAAAARIGGPVMLMADVPGLVRNSEVGTVLPDLHGTDDVRRGFCSLRERFGDRLAAVVVRPMTTSGVEVTISVLQEQLFGPLVLFGLGVATDMLADRVASTSSSRVPTYSQISARWTSAAAAISRSDTASTPRRANNIAAASSTARRTSSGPVGDPAGRRGPGRRDLGESLIGSIIPASPSGHDRLTHPRVTRDHQDVLAHPHAPLPAAVHPRQGQKSAGQASVESVITLGWVMYSRASGAMVWAWLSFAWSELGVWM